VNSSPEYSSLVPGHGLINSVIEGENTRMRFVTVFVIDSLQLFICSCLQQHTVHTNAYKRCWFYVRDTEFLPEFEVLSDIKIEANEDGSEEDQDNEYRRIERQDHF
jgi:hypothetical protein